MKLILSAVALTLVQASAHAVQNKVVYGDDNRLEVYEAAVKWQKIAKSTAAMVPTRSMTISNTGEQKTYTLGFESLGKARGLCEEENFREQNSAGYCSGFLVGKDLLVTAGHCMEDYYDCKGNSWVFDYKVDEATGKSALTYTHNQVYGCKEILKTELNADKMDYALIRLDRPVEDRASLSFRKAEYIKTDTEIVVIGHPSGLPTKVAGGAKVRAKGHENYFIANLDTFGGNSGSAVFNAQTTEVEGILVRGETDYFYDTENSCERVYQCNDDECRGEDVTRITHIKEIILRDELLQAAQDGNIERVDEILGVIATANINDDNGTTALMIAAKKGDIAMVKILLNKGKADYLQKDFSGNSALQFAYQSNNIELIAILAEYSDNYSFVDNNGNTLLHLAVLNRDIITVKKLLSKININSTNNSGKTAFYLAYEARDFEMMQLLSSSGADINLKDGNGKRVLQFSIEQKDLSMVQFFIENNVRVNVSLDDKLTYLHLAAKTGSTDIAKVLISAGAKINTQSETGSTPLHVAVSHNDLEMVTLLVENGADPKLKDDSKTHAYKLARIMRHRKIRRYLGKIIRSNIFKL